MRGQETICQYSAIVRNWALENCNFSLENLCPFKAKSFNSCLPVRTPSSFWVGMKTSKLKRLCRHHTCLLTSPRAIGGSSLEPLNVLMVNKKVTQVFLSKKIYSLKNDFNLVPATMVSRMQIPSTALCLTFKYVTTLRHVDKCQMPSQLSQRHFQQHLLNKSSHWFKCHLIIC